MTKRVPLPKRFSAAVTEPAHARRRTLDARHGLSNTDLPNVLLERLNAAFRDVIAGYGAPGAGDEAR